VPFIRTICCWTATALALSLASVHAQKQTSQSLTVPPYHNLPTTEGYFEGAGGVRLFYRVAGRDGDPIVFLHGSGGGINIGGYDMEPLAERGHRLLMFNERGAGRSEIITDAAKLRIEDFVQDVEAFRERFGLDKFGLIGLSWGSAVVLKYITAYPQHVSRVVFLSPESPTLAFYQERQKHLDSLKTDKERQEEKQVRERIRTAPDAEVPALCKELFQASHRWYVVDTISRTPASQLLAASSGFGQRSMTISVSSRILEIAEGLPTKQKLTASVVRLVTKAVVPGSRANLNLPATKPL
jgi:pimeloyl-ACP methyl ester carboxylesterase